MSRACVPVICWSTAVPNDVAKHVETLSADGNPMRSSARALGLAAWKAERFDDAVKLFQQIANDSLAPANIRQRSNTMLDLMRAALVSTCLTRKAHNKTSASRKIAKRFSDKMRVKINK